MAQSKMVDLIITMMQLSKRLSVYVISNVYNNPNEIRYQFLKC